MAKILTKDEIKAVIALKQAEMPFDVYSRTNPLPTDGGMIVTIPGVRRCGKSTRMELAINDLLARGVPRENILWIGFDDERFALMKADELDLILESYREMFPDTPLKDVWMFFDEIPLVENWELFVLRVFKSYCKNIFVCGSNAHTLSKDMKSELRGWPVEFETWPLSFAEYCAFRKLDPSSALESERAKVRVAFDDYNRFGALPEIALTTSVPLRYKRLQGYFDTMLLKDFIEHFNVRNASALRFFLKRVMANIANPLSVNAIYGEIKAQGLKVSKDELYVWLEEARDIYLFVRVPKFSRSLAKQESSPAKYYVIDNGLRNATIPIQSDERGKQLENTVFLDLLRRKTNAETIAYCQGRGECDFVVFEEERVKRLVQVTWEMSGSDVSSVKTRMREVNGLLDAAEELGCSDLTIVTHDEEETIRERGFEIRVVPAWKVLSCCARAELLGVE
jgi:uncharacterized protein